MREIYEFRILERYAPLLFSKGEGEVLKDWIRKINIAPEDPKFAAIGELAKELRSKDDHLFFGWNVVRTYTKAELDDARLFQLLPVARFAPEGERCGTVYDDSDVCPHCGSGGRITEGLFVSQTRLPKTSDIAMSIAHEIIVSQRLVDAFTRENITGVVFQPLHKKKRKEDGFCGWYEWIVTSGDVEIAPPTRVGDGPFDLETEGKQACPYGDNLGHNLLSELTVRAESVSSADVMLSRQYIGLRRGVIRPRRQIMVSPRVHALFLDYRLKGATFEVAHAI